MRVNFHGGNSMVEIPWWKFHGKWKCPRGSTSRMVEISTCPGGQSGCVQQCQAGSGTRSVGRAAGTGGGAVGRVRVRVGGARPPTATSSGRAITLLVCLLCRLRFIVIINDSHRILRISAASSKDGIVCFAVDEECLARVPHGPEEPGPNGGLHTAASSRAATSSVPGFSYVLLIGRVIIHIRK